MARKDSDEILLVVRISVDSADYENESNVGCISIYRICI